MGRLLSAFALWAVLGLACSGAAPPPTVPVPLDPAGLDGAAVALGAFVGDDLYSILPADSLGIVS